MAQVGFNGFLGILVMALGGLMVLQGLLGLAGAWFAPRLLRWRVFRRRDGAPVPRRDHLVASCLQVIAGLGIVVAHLRVGPGWSRGVLAVGMLALCVLMVRYYRWRGAP